MFDIAFPNMKEESDSVSVKALKIAKKSLKKHDSESMKLKALAKLVAEKLGDSITTHKMVKMWIEKSDKFCVSGKDVSFNKKRSVSPDNVADNSDQSPAKKARKENSSSASSAPIAKNKNAVEEWRKNNKIVVMHAMDDEQGKKETEKISKDAALFPFSTFEDPACVAAIPKSLLRQCTEGNGFTKPSPIQAQAWPILMHTRNGRKCDVVGIAETGSGK